MSNCIIELKNISKRFGAYHALRETSLTINNGEFITILGPSGCGKTTLLRLISGFEKPDTGRIYINNQDVTDLAPEKRHLNLIFQSYALFPHMTVFDNVAFGLRCKKIAKNEVKQRVIDVLRMVKLETLAEHKPGQLSGGQQQRVAIARAIVNEPLLLLLDEPLSALDYNLRKKMQIELKQLQHRLGITFIFVTHDQEEALSMSDRIAVMSEGSIDQLGTPKSIYEEPNSLYIAECIGKANIFVSTIENLENGNIVFSIENKKITLSNKKNLSINQKIHVVVRPEDIKIWSEDKIAAITATNMLSGVIEQVIYKGSLIDFIVRLPSDRLILITKFFGEGEDYGDHHDFRINERVCLDWTAGREVVLP